MFSCPSFEKTWRWRGGARRAKFRLALVENAGARPNTSMATHRIGREIADSSVDWIVKFSE